MIYRSFNKSFVSVIVILLLCLIRVTSIAVQASGSNNNLTFDLLIIAPQVFVKEVNRLVDHKNSVGVLTKLVSLEDVYRQMANKGRDNPEKIKYFIKYSIEQWHIKYVLFVGGLKNQGPYWYLPIRYVYSNEGYSDYYISDLYYADIYDKNDNFSSWDTNNNGIYGEWIGNEAEDKDIDLYPDVYVGRLACQNNFDVKIMVDKIITYETETYGKEWFDKIVVASGDTYPTYWNSNWTGYEGEEIMNMVLENMSDFEPIKLYESEGTLRNPRDVVRAINGGCGFICLAAHGSPSTLRLLGHNRFHTIRVLYNFNMNFLINKDMLPICVVAACNNLQFDVSIRDSIVKNLFRPWRWLNAVPECWGWKLTSKINGGSIATIGCTSFALTKEDKKSNEGALDYLVPRFFWRYGVNRSDMLGEVWGKSINDYLDKYPIDWNTPAGGDSVMDAKTVQQWVIFGDPSLKIGGYDQDTN